MAEPKTPDRPDNKPSDDAGKVPILIDGVKFHPPRGDATGRQLRALASIGEDRDLWLDLEGALDNLIEDDEVVHLKPEMRFFTVPRVINPGRC